MIYGMFYAGGAKFPGVLAANHPTGWAAKFFLNVFGDARPAARLLLQAGKTTSVMFHILYKSNHSFSLADLPQVRAGSLSLIQMVRNHPGVEFRISAACEHNLGSTDAKKFSDTAMAPFTGLDNVVAVNSPINAHGIVPGIVTDFHCGGSPMGHGPYQFDYDGCSAFDAETPADITSFGDAQVFYFWFPQMNGRKTTNDMTPISQRHAWPTAELLHAGAYLGTDKGVTHLPKGFLWKSVDEQSNVPPVGRELKPVLICPPNAPHAQITDAGGQLIATSGSPMPFHDGRFRYYFNDFGYHYGALANRLVGSPSCNVLVGGKQFGTVNPGFRENEYRS